MIANGTKFGRYEIWVRFTSRGTATQTRVPNTCRAASDWRQRLDTCSGDVVANMTLIEAKSSNKEEPDLRSL